MATFWTRFECIRAAAREVALTGLRQNFQVVHPSWRPPPLVFIYVNKFGFTQTSALISGYKVEVAVPGIDDDVI